MLEKNKDQISALVFSNLDMTTANGLGGIQNKVWLYNFFSGIHLNSESSGQAHINV